MATGMGHLCCSRAPTLPLEQVSNPREEQFTATKKDIPHQPCVVQLFIPFYKFKKIESERLEATSPNKRYSPDSNLALFFYFLSLT